MAAEATSPELVRVVALLGAAVIAVPIFRKLGLGSVLGYLAAGLLIGPFGLGWFTDPQAIIHVAELGVVMFLFVVGLEMQPSHLWAIRKDIFGLGLAQVGTVTVVLTLIGKAMGFSWPVAFVGGAGFVLTSTAIVMQLLSERGDIALPRGQKMVAILLFEDLLIVPLLIGVAFLSPIIVDQGDASVWRDIGIAAAALVGLVVAGRWLLNPLFRVLAAAKAREVMTAAALLVVLGAAVLMQVGGLSSAMGAFLAGVLLSESTFRHQLEADIEPFRGLLMGLFFLGVGMALNLDVVAGNWQLIAMGVAAYMLAKAACIYVIARMLRSSHADALDRTIIMAQGGEFAFVLFSAATSERVIDATTNANLTAIVILSMVLTPIIVLIARLVRGPDAGPSADGLDTANGLSGSVLMIGFGRFGQVVSQALLARDVDVTIIDNDVDMIRSAEDFGFKIYYGDGTRGDVLHAAGAGSAHTIAVCTDNRESTNRIVHLIHEEFPQAKVLARSFDRQHALELAKAGVDFQIRETFESALRFSAATLQTLDVPDEEIEAITEDIRSRDRQRFELEIAADDVRAGRTLLRGNVKKQEPLFSPRREGRSLNDDNRSGLPTPGETT